LRVYVSGQALPSVTVDCTLNSNSFENLGRIAISGNVGDCVLFASLDESLHATMMIVTDNGEKVELRQQSIVIGAGQNSTVEVNISSWIPTAGTVKINLQIIDGYGRILSQESVTALSRASGWNIGIGSFNADGDIRIGIERAPTYERLENTICQIHISSDDGDWEVTKIIDVTSSDYAPTILINDPGTLKTDMKLTATLSCEQPYDIDDNAEDNVMSTFYKEDSVLAVGGDDLVIATGLAAILIVIAWLAGLFKVSSTKTGNEASSSSQGTAISSDAEENSASDKLSSKQDALKQQQAKMDDEITLHSDGEDTPVQDKEAAIEMIEVFDEVETEDTSTLGRFASLRDEIRGDEEATTSSEPVEDRMNQFFES
jgi:hypothetical protein